jgi:hypothetical protein
MLAFVYFNIRLRTFSIMAKEGVNKGKVVAHADTVTLRNVSFKVSEAGRQRVLREKRKNVHAGVVGELVTTQAHNADLFARKVSYNPYKGSSFVYVDDLSACAVADVALLSVNTQRIPSVYAL